MESKLPEEITVADGGTNVTFGEVATANASSLAPDSIQRSTPMGDASPPTAAAVIIMMASAILPPGLIQTDSTAPDLSCAMAGDGTPLCGRSEVMPPLAPIDMLQSSENIPWRAHSELLPPARLVEVAHAALQSSGFRRRQTPSAQQASQQEDGSQAQSASAFAGADVERSSSAKRDLRGHSGCDSDRPEDTKRLRKDACSEGPPHAATAEPPPSLEGVADAIARVGPLPSLQPSGALISAVKREMPPLPPLPNSSVTSPFSRPLRARSSGSGGQEGVTAVAGHALAGTHGPLRSAFSHAASLPTEWQPGCSVTTGRRSARSPAPKGSRNLSLMRATSVETASGSVSRRGSGFVPPAPSAFSCPAENVAGGGPPPGGGAAAVVPAAGVPEEGVSSASAAAAGAQRGGGAPESAASADLRRLAQLAEAAAMLEEQMVPKGGQRAATLGTGGQEAVPGGSGWHMAASDDSGLRAAGAPVADGTEQPILRPRAGSLTAGGLTAALSGAAGADLLRPSASVHTSGLATLRSVDSHPGQLPDSAAAGGAAAGSGRAGGQGTGREGSPVGDDEGTGGSRRRPDADSEAASEDGNHPDGDDDDDDDDGDGAEDGGDGSNDSAGGGSSAGGGGGRTLTERYRAALKASAKQRGRGQSVVKLDLEKPPRGSNRNGLCARIASITKERLQQVYHLNIEEAARELGIGMTKLKEHCRTLGIPRWPSRKLKSMDKLIESLNERAMTEPATKEVIADILAEIESFKRAIYENPCLEVEEDIKRLRQSNFKKEYQQRQVEQRLRGGLLGGSSGETKGSGAAIGAPGGSGSSGGGGRSSSLGGSQHLQGGGASGGLSATVIAAAASAGSGAALSHSVMSQPALSPSLAASLGPALMAGQLAAGAAAAQGSAQLVHALAQAQAQVQQLPGQVPLLAQGQLQQLLMAQQPAALQQLMAQRALGALAPPTLLLPGMMPPQLQQVQPQQPKPMGTLAAIGEALQEAE